MAERCQIKITITDTQIEKANEIIREKGFPVSFIALNPITDEIVIVYGDGRKIEVARLSDFNGETNP